MRREPLLLPVTALAAGILLAHFGFFRLEDLILPALFALVAAGAAMLSSGDRRLRLATACAGLVLAGMATQILHRPTRTPRLTAEDAETVILSGCVINPPVFSPDREQFTLRLAPKASIRLTVNLKPDEKFPLEYGQRVEVPAKIRTTPQLPEPGCVRLRGLSRGAAYLLDRLSLRPSRY